MKDMTTIDSAVWDSVHPDLAAAFQETTLNKFMSMGRAVWSKVRAILQNDILSMEKVPLIDQSKFVAKLVKQSDAKMHLPAKIGDYTGS